MKRPRTSNQARSTAHLSSRTRPRLGYCQQCKAPVFGCIYDALPLKLDTYSLSAVGELKALFLGCKTWMLCNGHVSKRNTWAIRTSPTGLGGVILRSHICGNEIAWGPEIKELDKHKYDEPDF